MPIMSLIQKKNNKKKNHQQDNIVISYKRKPLQFEGAAFKIRKNGYKLMLPGRERPMDCSLFSYHTGQKKEEHFAILSLFFNSR